MKKITINELVKIMAEKVDVEYSTDNFKDFEDFLNEIIPVFELEFDNIYDLIYYNFNENIPERNVEGDISVFNDIYDDFENRFHFEESADWFNNDNGLQGEYKKPFDIPGKRALLNYISGDYTSIKDFLEYFRDVSKEYNCEFNISIGTDGYGNFNLSWTVSNGEIKSNDAYYEIIDDDGEELFFTLYWIAENFNFDTFEGFESLGVELRYEGK